MKTVTINTLYKLKQQGDKFPVITAYDAAFSRLIEQVGIEVVLVGDSLGNVIQGQDSTLPVTMEHMTYHVSAVRRGNSKSLIVADLPFMAYATEQQAMDNAARIMQAGAHVVKLEGGAWLARTVAMLTERGIPVCGHLGLTPQSVNKLGGYRVQGRDEAAAEQMINDARALEKAGIDLLVLECVPATLAKAITEALATPVIGIGAGADTDAQVLVLYDMLGLSPHQPSFAKNFLAETGDVTAALNAYAEAVRTGLFPQSAQSF
ncbi:MAG: 3-methyl-2-oxobutanoate hydroxymethyltransferase [Porticoccus sp.]|jgi:3-methyl-2-oxobutanoate hydroxymethyltransferase|uniref:3-methyl-2-oxobutanoate hydroxymethyltransferase n=1 Tax=Porticoccus sp. TaxID=2024853 RepID=UPI0032983FC1